MRRITFFLLSLMLLMPIFTVFEGYGNEKFNPSVDIPIGLTGHEPILIEGNDGLNSTATAEDWDGSGTSEDPYMIKDLFFDGNGTGYCLKFSNTTLCVTVLNCTFTNTSYIGVYGSIQLINATNVVFDRIKSHENSLGFHSYHSSNITLRKSSLYNNKRGINFYQTNDSIIEDSSGEIDNSYNTNTQLSFCTNIRIYNYSVEDLSYYAIDTFHCENITIRSSSIALSKNGYYFRYCSNVSVKESNLYDVRNGIVFAVSDNGTFENLNFQKYDNGNSRCIDVHYSEYATFNTIIAGSGDEGLRITSSQNIVFKNLNLAYFSSGIMVDRGNNIHFTDVLSISIGSNNIYFSTRIYFSDCWIEVDDSAFNIYLCDNFTLRESRIKSQYGSCLFFYYNEGNTTFCDLILEAPEFPCYYIEYFINNTHMKNISIKGKGMHFKDFFFRLAEPMYSESINNRFENITLNDRPIFISWNEDLGGRTFTGNFSQIILFNSTNGTFNEHTLMNSVSGVSAYDAENITFMNIDTSNNDDSGFLLLKSRNLKILKSTSRDYTGLDMYYTTNVTIHGNHFDTNVFGIRTIHGDGIRCRGNKFSHPEYPLYPQYIGCEIISNTNFISQENEYQGTGEIAIKIRASNCIFSDDYVKDFDHGILISGSSNVIVEDSSFENIELSAIDGGDGMDSLKVSGSLFNSCKVGIYSNLASDIHVSGTRFDYCDTGLSFSSSSQICVVDSVFIENEYGMRIASCDGGSVTGSLFLRNNEYAIKSLNSRSFEIWNNSFIQNNHVNDTPDPVIKQCYDNSDDNRWHSSEFMIGNHWSDLTSPDLDMDEIVDMSYKLEGEGEWSKYPLVFSPVDLISPPRSLVAESFTDHVLLTWEKPLKEYYGRTNGYKIYRGFQSDKMEEIESISGLVTSISDVNIEQGIRYYYLVRATCSYGAGAPSDIVEAISDSTPPEITFISPSPGQGFNKRSVTISWKSEDPESEITRSYYCLDGGNFIEIGGGSSIVLLNLTDGYHEITIKAVNSLELEGTSVLQFNIDTTPPELSFSEEGPIYFDGNTVELEWKSEDDISGIGAYYYSINGEEWNNNGLTSVLEIYLEEGTHEVSVASMDGLGNRIEKSIVVIVDKTDPEISIISPVPDEYINQDNLTLELELFDGISGIHFLEYNIDSHGSVRVIPSTVMQIPHLSEGDHFVSVRVFDRCHNSAETSINLTIDRIHPQVLYYGPIGDFVSLKEDIFIEFDEEISLDSFRFSIDSKGNSAWIGNRFEFNPSHILDPGREYVIEIHAEDLAGNGMYFNRWFFTTTDRGILEGRILDENGVPMEGLQVEVEGEPVAFTDAYGRFSFDVLMGQKRLEITGESIRKITFDIFVNADTVHDIGTITSKPKQEDEKDFEKIFFIIPILLLIMLSLIVLFLVIMRKRKDSRFEFFIEDEQTGNDQGEEDFEEFWIDLGGEILTDHYQVLGIPRNSSHQEIRKAYRMMAGKYHPDMTFMNGEMSKEEMADMMSMVNDAKEVLLNPLRRNMYDAWLHDRELEM